MEVWKELLREKVNQPGKEFWISEYSGKLLELSVPSSRERKIDEYRKSVIEIGKIIQHIQNEYNECAEKPAVQLFPNLMDIRLIAVLRPPENEIVAVNGHSDNNKELSFEDFLANSTKKSSLFADSVSLPDNLIAEIMGSDCEYKTITLSSEVSNPFIWVRTGYLLENISAFFRKMNTDKPVILEQLTNAQKKRIAAQLSENRVPQALILLKKNALIKHL